MAENKKMGYLNNKAKEFLKYLNKIFFTRIKNGYLQFYNLLKIRWEWVHRKVAEIMTGKKIPKGYEVHHKNKVILDNDPDNLEVLSKEKHRVIHRKEKINETEKAETPKNINQVTLEEALNIQKLFNAFKSSGFSRSVCPRCGGGGFLPEFRHVAGGVCFLCNGNGNVGHSDFEKFEPFNDEYDDDFDDRFDDYRDDY